LTPKKAEAVPKLIISLGWRYVQYINRSYRRTATLWDSRYKSSLVQAESCLLSCQRCIELNPVRAAMMANPAHYGWIGYRANALGQAGCSPDAASPVSRTGRFHAKIEKMTGIRQEDRPAACGIATGKANAGRACGVGKV